ncbi:hypothetical protein LJR231_001579 [Phyllobacterium sp. LjRoot231]|uniref:hypothetical protein n=1 Tax=Phyllobacterium sp. LjRoot231 TaxID=3342289 RepID=UPI003ECE8E38
MTTIAYRDGVLASDSMLSGDALAWGSVSKIVRAKNGAIGGACGRLEKTLEFLAWLEAFNGDALDHPPSQMEADGIVVTPDLKLLLWTGGSQLAIVDAPFLAIGTGAKIAMGAMAMGASPAQAIRIAREYDVYTGGEIKILSIDADSSPQTRSIAQ